MRAACVAPLPLLLVCACIGDNPQVNPDASPADGSTDEAAAPPATFCTGHPSAAFCEDFDRSAAPPWSFTAASQALGPVAANEAVYTSQPRAALFQLAPATAVFQATFLTKNTPGQGAKGAKLSLAFRLDKTNPGSEGRDFFVVRTDGVLGIALHRYATAGDAGTTEAWSVGPDFSPVDTPSLHTWLPMVLDVTFDAATGGADGGVGGGTFTLTVASKPFGPFPVHGAATTPGSTVGVLIGSQAISATTQGINFSIDDVVLEMTP